MDTLDLDLPAPPAGEVLVQPAIAPQAQSTQLVRQDQTASPLIAMLQQVLLNPQLPMERVNQAFDFYQRVEAAEAKKAYDTALAAAQTEFPTITKNRRVNFVSTKGETDYRHEDLAELVEKCGPVLARHGISHKWRTENPINAPIKVTCILTHRAGHSEENALSGPRDESGNKNGLQGIASTVTYLERYTFKSAIGQASRHDDDGRAGGGDPIKPGAGAPAATPNGRLADPDGGPAIASEEQLANVREVLESTGADVAGFCRYFQMERVGDLKAVDYDRAIAALKKKVRR